MGFKLIQLAAVSQERVTVLYREEEVVVEVVGRAVVLRGW